MPLCVEPVVPVRPVVRPVVLVPVRPVVLVVVAPNSGDPNPPPPLVEEIPSAYGFP